MKIDISRIFQISLLLLFVSVEISLSQEQCGAGFGSCSEPSPCCNKDGICGSSITDCGNGCQSDYGVCNGK